MTTRALVRALPPGVRPLPRAPLEHRLTLILLPKNHIYSKKISVSFYPVWTPFDMDFMRNKKHATNRNWHWTLDQYVSPKNSIKSCQKYMKVEEYWHGQSKIIDTTETYHSLIKDG